MNSKAFKFCAAALLCLAAQARAAGDTVAVLSSASGAYMEAFSAFQAAHGGSIEYFDASREKPVIPPGTRTVVAFGTKAASQAYPDSLDLVYCMAPGFFLDGQARAGKTIKISMRSSPDLLFPKLLQMQPSLKRLWIFWTSPGYATFPEDYGAAGARLELSVKVVKVESAEDLPGLLRKALGKADALWLPPDPLLISPETLMILKEFSWSNGIPLYAATKGLAREGACAAIGISFTECGSAAAAAVRDLQAGTALPGVIFTEKLEITLNASAARHCGLQFPSKILREASYLFP
ncbi:MAG TPA: hypothetical protein DEQ38_03065 [Elusimicrobia bacterium]|nr:MAG: hypothetical protein A2089_00215 [Elusimicrobia bacterium GWD2_63_28]HCC47085.1 hypothetical protein [Elusimicrobiota bacterium]